VAFLYAVTLPIVRFNKREHLGAAVERYSQTQLPQSQIPLVCPVEFGSYAIAAIKLQRFCTNLAKALKEANQSRISSISIANHISLIYMLKLTFQHQKSTLYMHWLAKYSWKLRKTVQCGQCPPPHNESTTPVAIYSDWCRNQYNKGFLLSHPMTSSCDNYLRCRWSILRQRWFLQSNPVLNDAVNLPTDKASFAQCRLGISNTSHL